MALSEKRKKNNAPFESIDSKPTVFPSPLHEASFKQLLTGIRTRSPLQTVIGEPGTGKTVLLRGLLKAKPAETQAVFCFSSAIDASQLLCFVREYLPNAATTLSASSELEAFQDLARLHCKSDGSLLVFVDEAHHLHPSALELMLDAADWSANGGDRRIQFVAAGVEVFRQDLTKAQGRHPSVQGMVQVCLKPLSAKQVVWFIRAQLERLGHPSQTFTSAALDQVALMSRGVPRLINNLYAQALHMAQSHGEANVSEAHVRAAAEDLELTLGRSRCGHALLLARASANKAGRGGKPQPPGDRSSTQSDPGRHSLSDQATQSALLAALARRVEAAAPDKRPVSSLATARSPKPGRADHIHASEEPNETWPLPPGIDPERGHEVERHSDNGSGDQTSPGGGVTASETPEAGFQATLDDRSGVFGDKRPTPGPSPAHAYLRPAAIAAGLLAAIAGGAMFYPFERGQTGNPLPLLAANSPAALESEARNSDAIDTSEQVAIGLDPGDQPPTSWFAPVKAVAVRAEGALHNAVSRLTEQTRAVWNSGSETPFEGPIRVALQGDDAAIAAQIEALRAAADDRRKAGDLDAALELVEEAITLRPDDPELLSLHERLTDEREQKAALIAQLLESVQAQQASGNYLEAMASVAEALEQVPGEPALVALKKEIEDQHEGAMERARTASRIAVLDADARARIETGNYDEARSLVDEALVLAPGHPVLLSLRDEIDVQEREAEARELVAQELERLKNEARSALAANDHDLALTRIDEALALSDDDELTMLRDEAVSLQAAAIERERLAGEIRQRKDDARALIANGDLDAAEERLEQVLEQAANDAEALALIEEISELQAAIREAQRIATEVGRLRSAARQALAAEDYDTALKEVGEALSLSPRDPESLLLQSEIEKEHQTVLEERRIAAQITELEEQARTALTDDDLETALDRADQALTLGPENEALTTLRNEIESRREAIVAQTLEAARGALADANFEQAAQLVDQALGLAPENTDLQTLQAEIESQQAATLERERISAEVARLSNEAELALAEKTFDSALTRVDQALALTPNDEGLAELRDRILTSQEQARVERQLADIRDTAQAHIDAGELAAAQAAVEEGLTLAAGDTELLALQDRVETLQAEERERERLRTATEAHLANARDAVEQGDLESAAQQVDAATALLPEHPETLALRDEIARIKEEALAQRQRELEALALAAQEALATGDFEAARGKASEALALSPDTEALLTLKEEIETQRIAAEAAALLDQAKAEQKENRFAEAIETAERALTLAPDNAELQGLRAQLAVQHEEALERERIARQLEELRVAAFAQRSNGDLVAALESVDAALSIAPEDAQLHALRGELVVQQRTAIQSDQVGREVDLLRTQSEQLLAEQAYDAALETALAAITLAPNDESLRQFYSEIYRARQTAIREQQRQQALTTAIDDIENLLNSASLEDARSTLDQALDATPEEPRLLALSDRLEALERGEDTASAPEERSASDEGAGALIRSGDEMVRLKDIAAARLLYEAAIDAGASDAATPLGMTYDPMVLKELGVIGIAPDSDRALHWYQIGEESGDSRAEERIKRLRDQPAAE